MKKCNRCKVEKSKNDFYTNPKRYDGLQTYCKPCHLEYGRERYATPESYQRRQMNRELYKEKRKESSRKWYLKKTHKITPEEYDNLYLAANGKCGICLESKEYYLHVDHNHITGKIRGLLCQSCNTGIGLLKENTMILKSAIKYIKKYEDN